MTGAEILALCAGAAAGLGAGWTACPAPNPDGALLRHADGRELYVWQDHRDRYGGRVRVQGRYPGGWQCTPDSAPVITVRASRGGAALASEIRRRMLPAYEPALAIARERHGRRERETAAREALADAVIAIVPGGMRSAVQGSERVSVDLPGIFQRADISYDGSRVDLKLSWLPADTALRVLRALYGPDSPVAADSRPEASCEPARWPEGRLRRLRNTVLCGVAAALTW